MTENGSFRQRLDAVLRTRDVQRVQAFLIGENQWDEGVPADPQFAMWMMIAGSQTLRELHGEARTWLVSHGHEMEAEAVLGSQRSDKGRQGARPPQAARQRSANSSRPAKRRER